MLPTNYPAKSGDGNKFADKVAKPIYFSYVDASSDFSDSPYGTLSLFFFFFHLWESQG